MKINIKTSIALTPAISEYVDKLSSALGKFLADDTTVQCDLELARTTNHHKNGDIFKAEIHIVGKDKNIYASVEKEDLYAAIDTVKDEVLREIKNANEKEREAARKGGAEIKNMLKEIAQ